MTQLTPLTREQAAFVGLYTGFTFGPFSDIHKLAEDTLGRPIFTHEFAGPDLHEQLREKLLPQIEQIAFQGDPL